MTGSILCSYYFNGNTNTVQPIQVLLELSCYRSFISIPTDKQYFMLALLCFGVKVMGASEITGIDFSLLCLRMVSGAMPR